MRYDTQPDEDFGGGGFLEDETRRATPRTTAAPGAQVRPIAQQPTTAGPRTFSEMQRAGMARPPMPGFGLAGQRPMPYGGVGGVFRGAKPPAPTATVAPRINPMTSTASPGVGQPTGAAMPMGPGGTLQPVGPTVGPTAGGAPAFDPMEWLRQQVMGGSQNVLDRSMAYLGGQIDDQFNLEEQRLREDMARRGLADSTVYGGRMQDLNVSRRSAKSDLGERLALQDLERRQGMVGQMAGMDAEMRNYLLQLLGFGYGG